MPLDLTRRPAGPGRCDPRRRRGDRHLARRDGTRVARDVLARSRAAAGHVIGAGADAVVRGARPVLPGRNRQTARRLVRLLRRSDDPPRWHAARAGHVHLRGAPARSIGERVEIVFDGMRMGSFDGGLAYTFYPGSRLIQQEAVLTTYDPDVAYYYDAGLDMAAPADRTAGQQHALRGRLLRHRGRAAARHAERVAGRARAGSGAPPHAGGEDRRRQRCGVSGAAPVLLSARFLLEPRLRLAPRLARPRRRSASGSCATRTGSTTRG